MQREDQIRKNLSEDIDERRYISYCATQRQIKNE